MNYSVSNRLSELEILSITARRQLQDALEDETPDPVVVAAAKKLYLKRLRDQLQFNKFLETAYKMLLPPDYEGGGKVSDSLLTRVETAEIGRNLKAVDAEGTELSAATVAAVGAFVKKHFKDNDARGDRLFGSPSTLRRRAALIDKLAAGLSLPDGWEPVLTGSTELDRIAKLEGRSERLAAYAAYALDTRPRHVEIRLKEGANRKHRLLFEISGDASSGNPMLIPSNDEINAVLSGFDQAAEVFDLTNLSGRDSGKTTLTDIFNKTGTIEIRVGTHLPDSSKIAKDSKAVGTNGIAGASGFIYLNLNNIRTFANPETIADHVGYYSVDPQDEIDKLTGTTIHEIGHVIHYSIMDSVEHEDEEKNKSVPRGSEEVDTRYAVKNGFEHFAESMLKFVLRGQLSPRLRQRLIQEGILLK
jgi:hypothetical protein